MWTAVLAFLKPIGAFLKAIPWQIWAALAMLALLFLVAHRSHKEGYNEGAAYVQGLWDADVEEAKRLGLDREKVTVKTEIRYVDRVQVIKEKGETREKIVTKFVPRGSCTADGNASGGFRVFHDASVRNTVPDTAEIATAAPVPLTDVASTVNHNYGLCHIAYARVKAWEEWADEQCKLNKNGCPDGL